jgi:glycosyltransferase involved in cell wall biosynthesis
MVAKVTTTATRGEADHVVVSLPCFGDARHYLREAVQSILAQTHKNLTLVVINDGGPPPWSMLSDFTDSRIIRVDLPVNRGRYFADSVVIHATRADYVLIQDADDRSNPRRLEKLLRALHETPGAVAAVSDVWRGGEYRSSRAITQKIGAQLRHRAPHHALFRVDALRRIGGTYGGVRVGYDTFLMNALRFVGQVAHVPEALYHRRLRAGSLTSSRKTGMGSAYRNKIQRHLSSIYRQLYSEYRRKRLSTDKLRKILEAQVSPRERLELRKEAARVAAILRNPKRLELRKEAARLAAILPHVQTANALGRYQRAASQSA